VENLVLPEELRTALRFLTSLGIGLLLGLQHERTQGAKAGLRTFALVAVFGTVAGLLNDAAGGGWIGAAGLLLVGLMIISAYHGEEKPEADSGTTTVIALLLCYGLGVMVWHDRNQLAVAIAIVATVLLQFKAELHGFSARLSRSELASILQFAVLTFVVLPLLPDEGFGPYAVLNPYHIWLMVVLVSGLSLAGYLALRLVGAGRSLLLAGVAGGLVSSTATTVVYARHGSQLPALAPIAGSVVLIANLVVLARLGVMAMVVAPALQGVLLPVLASGLLCGLLALAVQSRGLKAAAALEVPELENPTSMRVAVGFGLLYGVILLASAWTSERAGSAGLYAVAAVSGLADVDAITLSSLRLFNTGQATGGVAATAVAIAFFSATAFKLGALALVGGRAMVRRCAPALAAALAGTAAGLALFG
jgi:uncharacterized membrane protein (DUF4010 family)